MRHIKKEKSPHTLWYVIRQLDDDNTMNYNELHWNTIAEIKLQHLRNGTLSSDLLDMVMIREMKKSL